MINVKIILILPMLLRRLVVCTTLPALQDKCMIPLDVRMCYSVEPAPFPAIPCGKADVCQKTFNISYVDLPPYSKTNILPGILHTCCGGCVNIALINTFRNVSEITESSISSSHFIFPVLGQATASRMYGYHFIPYGEPSTFIYVTAKNEKVMVQLVTAVLEMWPLLVICFLLTVISGFIGWSLETYSNEKEFPRPFLRGCFEGFWWSFVSMTTVGYGDKIPKSTLGRMYSIIWIVSSITIFSIITAMLSAEITIANTPEEPVLSGEKVGALRHRIYDASFIAQHGGVLIDVDATAQGGTTNAISRLINMLKGGEIYGFVLDRHTFVSYYRNCVSEGNEKLSREMKDNLHFLETGTVRTEKVPKGKKVSYGFLVKNIEDYEYFADFIVDNQNTLNTCYLLYINSCSGNEDVNHVENALFATSGGFFWPSFVASAIIIVIFIGLGSLYEFLRRKHDDQTESNDQNE